MKMFNVFVEKWKLVSESKEPPPLDVTSPVCECGCSLANMSVDFEQYQ